MQKPNIFEQISSKSMDIFANPKSSYPYNDLILGCQVNCSRQGKMMYAVAPNTWRGFHKIDKSGQGAGEVFKNHFISHKHRILESLKQISNKQEMNEFEDSIRENIKGSFSNIKQYMLRPYNKLRKPIDLYIEHIVAMAFELEGYREKLYPVLFLPLDSQIFQSEFIFSQNELSAHGLDRQCTFKDVSSKDQYISLQNIVNQRALQITKLINAPFESISFDLLWNNRYLKDGTTLFETNI